jgi:DNA-binding NarL/FixJ family response regulator
MLAISFDVKRIAKFYGLSQKTIEYHVRKISRATDGPGPYNLARWTLFAIRNGFCPKVEPMLFL